MLRRMLSFARRKFLGSAYQYITDLPEFCKKAERHDDVVRFLLQAHYKDIVETRY